MSKYISTLFIIIISTTTYSQINTFLNESRNDLIEIMTSHFEDVVCSYYSIESENSSLAIKKYVEDSSKTLKGFKNLERIITPKTIKLLNKSKIELKNYLWITKKQKQQKSKYLSYSELSPQVKEVLDSTTTRYYKNLESKDSELTINYYDEYGKNISINSNDDIADLITTFKELHGNGDSGLIATALVNLTNEDYKNKATKTFIAFELFYACLNSYVENE
ncbi:hypothetical protein EV195_11079 [Tenacibaculum skagerrakense]|uniref:Uncharacterized protein n=1 Tax=Tenacibaculum skagerrakense TaxID=186571 RepID=A0A4R2NMU8_9FLAO|nr:hypothetical protein [Tenacibaculum skagerrakense]TCP22950.1 hypothetical protein EV195_11079 [Tenacibaculum skagerrakense]